MIYVHEIKLPETSEFAEKFNYCSELWQKSQDENLSEDERKGAFDDFWAARYRLESGY